MEEGKLIYGEKGFEDFATNSKYATGGNNITRPLTSTIASGEVAQIAIRNSPLDSHTISEIKRISKKGGHVTYEAPKNGGQFDVLKEGLGDLSTSPKM